ncbi:MAG: transcriptional regulator, partial [Clostridium sp.]|nr:transcriptional regulator [Clostridium sp.]
MNDGTVLGVSKNAAADMVKNFIKVVSNPALFSPTVYLAPEIIEYDEKRTIIHVHVPPSAEVHSYKKVIYDRVDDADVKVTATGTVAQMYIRKQNVFTEKKIYPYAKLEDLRLDLLPKIRILAQNHAGGTHPWKSMDDEELLKSAGLYRRDIATGEEEYNLAAIMLLGKDDVILNVAPAYVTDALVRKVNVDRYDDREVIKTNLIESYDRLMDFGKKHLPDKFFLEGDVNKSLRNTILREMVSNVLMHREFTNSYTAKFIIENKRMYVENANRAASDGYITEDNLEPIPKNPVIASFFRNIGYA